MKKTVDVILIVISFFIIYFLQSNIFIGLKIAGIMPNLFIILIAIIGLSIKEHLGFAFGVIFGLILDLTIGPRIGIYAISLGIIRIYCRYIGKEFCNG